VIVCILFSKIFFFVRSFVRLFFISFSRTSYDWTSEIFQHHPTIFSSFIIYTHTIPTLASILFPVLFFWLRVVILKEKRIYIYVCVYFFLLLHFFSLSSNQNKTKIVSVSCLFFFVHLSLTLSKQEKKNKTIKCFEKKGR